MIITTARTVTTTMIITPRTRFAKQKNSSDEERALMSFADNIAFGRQTKASSKESNTSNPSCDAVNGKLQQITCDASMKENSCPPGDNNKCFLTTKGDYNAYWMVEFGQAFTVSSMKLFLGEKSPEENGTEGKTRVCVPGIHLG